MADEAPGSSIPVERLLREASTFAATLVGKSGEAATELAQQRGYEVRMVPPEDEDKLSISICEPVGSLYGQTIREWFPELTRVDPHAANVRLRRGARGPA